MLGNNPMEEASQKVHGGLRGAPSAATRSSSSRAKHPGIWGTAAARGRFRAGSARPFNARHTRRTRCASGPSLSAPEQGIYVAIITRVA